MSDENTPTVLRKECREQKLERVVVFNDRAELKRVVQCDLKPGLNEVHVEAIKNPVDLPLSAIHLFQIVYSQNVTQRIIYDSLRVDGRGDGIIHDVQLREKPAIHEETDSPKAIELRRKVDEKEQEVYLLQDREGILRKRIEVLDKIVSEVGGAVVKPPKPERESFILNQETLDNLSSFFKFYENSSTEVRAG
ncbi:unnamed protein product [Strongylus vulgaris]|uniref:DUF4140 domain-containing protein n=1 Tax=Strongylus vulgaris TaxID=40348 RepID=A0A3P7I9N6_STRVU|nr:unnamed protein product [Strongylus vulgaris]